MREDALINSDFDASGAVTLTKNQLNDLVLTFMTCQNALATLEEHGAITAGSYINKLLGYSTKSLAAVIGITNPRAGIPDEESSYVSPDKSDSALWQDIGEDAKIVACQLSVSGAIKENTPEGDMLIRILKMVTGRSEREARKQ